MSPQRSITLFDKTGSVLQGTHFGNDEVTGDAGVDVILGQSGADRLKGNEGDDYVEGAQGSDWVEGNDGDDDLVGGGLTTLGASAIGQDDVADSVHGGPGDDVITGDNAVILRAGSRTSTTDRLGTSAAATRMDLRNITLLDLNLASPLAAPSLLKFGGDKLSGGSGNDVTYGQDGADQIAGGGGADYIEGNGGTDVLRGDSAIGAAAETSGEAPTTELVNATWPGSPTSPDAALDGASSDGQDDMIGGSSRAGFRDGGDDVAGNGQSDFQLGDNGTLHRAISGSDGSAVEAIYAERYAPGADLTDATRIRIADTADNPANTSTRFCPVDPAVTCEKLLAFGADTM
jgi:RTX calcium-binding nonapeptide repeat (4 copies)